MTRPRKEIVNLEATPYYHCIGRCVRRAFLCGKDRYSNRNYEHRRQWILDRLTELTEAFSIQVAAYAIMSNHYHLVLHIDNQSCQSWSDDDVIQRWSKLYPRNRLAKKYLKGSPLNPTEKLRLQDDVCTWRSRLYDLSWFMRCLNEHLARIANAEDQCTGRFWQGRFKSQGLIDERAILSCMAYVDLNPIRANMKQTLEDSAFTSIQQRIQEVHAANNSSPQATEPAPQLLPFIESEHKDRQFAAIPFNLKQYIDLVDWTGRSSRKDKRGAIPADTAPILEKMGLTDEEWLDLSKLIQGRQANVIHGGDILNQFYRRRRLAA